MGNATFTSVQLLSHIRIVATPWKGVARFPCLSPTPRPCSNSCPSSQWCHPTISSSVIPFSFCFQSFPASGSFQMSQFFASGGQSYWSFSFSISPSSEHSGLISFRLDWFGLPAVQGILQSLSNTTVQKHQFFGGPAFFMIQLSRPCCCSLVTQLCLTLCDPMGFSRQEYWSGLPFLSLSSIHDYWNKSFD